MFGLVLKFSRAAIFLGLCVSAFTLEVRSEVPAEVCTAPNSDEILTVDDSEVRVICAQGLVIEKHRYFRGSRSTASILKFTKGLPSEKLVFSKAGVNTSRVKFERMTASEWIVTRFFTSGERAGKIESREHLVGYDPEKSVIPKAFVSRKWFYVDDRGETLDFIEHYDPQVRGRITAKEKFSPDGKLRSIFKFTYEEGQTKPVGFVERDVSGKVLKKYSLNTPLDVESVYRQIGLSQKEVSRKVERRNDPNRFKIAIIDSGFDVNHPELADKWWNNPADPIDGVDNDGNGWADDNFGWDQVRDRGLPSETTLSFADRSMPLSHGTHVASIASRGLNDVALIGFSGDYTRPEYIEKISTFLKTHHVRVVNMSLGLPNDYKDVMGLRDSIKAYRRMVEENPETLFVVASGNTLPKGIDIDVHTNRQFPANLNLPNMIVVGALHTDVLSRRKYDEYVMAPYSNFGSSSVDILAPGSDVEAAALGGGLVRHSGTSMATPNVVNAVARLWTAYPELEATEVREILNTTAYKMKGDVPVRSGGFVDLRRATDEARRRSKQKAELEKSSSEERSGLKRSSASVTEDDRTRIEYLAGRSARRGANCWNSALFAKGLTVGVHFTGSAEFSFILNSPLCRKVEPAQRKEGDIVALRRFDGKGQLIEKFGNGEIHGYLHLGDESNFTKNGTSPKERYEFMSTAAIEKVYVRTNQQECRQMGIPREHCNLRSEYLRCVSMSQFQSQAQNQPLASQKPLLERVTLLEIRLQDIHMENTTLSASDLARAKKQIREEINLLSGELDKVDSEVKDYVASADGPSHEIAEFYADLIYYRLQSLDVFMF